MASIAENISSLRTRIRQAELRFGRSPHSVSVLAVSKTQDADGIQEAWAAGQREFGENYVQEALGKISELAQRIPDSGIHWHFIGPIQSNKTRDIAEHFSWVHSVERLKIAQRLSAQRPAELPPLNVCVQVNLSGEDSKSGLPLAEAPALCEQISRLPALRLRGLMAIPAPCDDMEQQRRVFRPLAQLRKEMSSRFPDFDTLSIGMSADYEAAIAEGSTLVRIGTALFGART